MKRTIIGYASLIVIGIISSGCGGAANGDIPNVEVAGLEIASQLSLVEAQDVASSPTISAGKAISLLSKAISSDTSTSYYTDPLNVYVHDGSMEALDTINEILCMFDQTKYADISLVNKGAYIALVDAKSCKKSEDKSDTQNNQSSGADADELEIWTVISERASDSAPQIIKVWLEEKARDEYDVDKLIQVKGTIFEAASDSNPFGIFRLDLKFNSPSTGEQLSIGYLEAIERDDGQVEFQFSMDDPKGVMATHVVMNADGSDGKAFTQFTGGSDGEFETKVFQVAYDASHFRRDDGTNDKCLDRVNFDTKVFRYGVYNEDGSRLTLEHPGFGIKAESGGIQYYGFAGYHGIWLPEELGITNGMTVTRSNNDGDTSSYLVMDAPGKLMRHSKIAITLGDILNNTLYYWNESTCTNYKAKWNGTNFVKFASEVLSTDGPSTWSNFAEEVINLNANGWYNFWRDGIGSLNLVRDGSALSNATVLIADSQEIVAPSDLASGDITLYCFNDCVKAEITAAQINRLNGESPYFNYTEGAQSAYEYTFNTSDMTLRYGGNAVKLADSITDLFGPNSWGINSGPMVDSLAGIVNSWDLWQAATYYTWETGPNDWNHYRGLTLNGEAVQFDPPVNLDYAHVASGDRYYLDFSGFGELNGIPWVEDVEAGRWYPEITIPDGASAVDINDVTYYIRALEMEQRMTEVAGANCSTLTFDDTITAPDADYVDPAIGTQPLVTDDPKVIKGALAGS